MAEWTTTIGAPGSSVSTALTWSWNSGRPTVSDELTERSGTDEITQLQIRSDGNCGLALAGSTSDLITSWENFESAFVFSVGDLALAVPGPNHSANRTRDTAEPYSWRVSTDKAGEIASFITAFRALTPSIQQGDLALTLRDALPLPLTFGAESVEDQIYPHKAAISALQLPAATGGNGALSHTVSTLPSGLVFDPETRQITGTPSTVGETTVTLTVTDTENATATLEFDIVVEPVINTIPPQGGERIRVLLTVGDGGNVAEGFDSNGVNWYNRLSGAEDVGEISTDSDVEVADNIDIGRFRLTVGRTPEELRLVSFDTGYGDIWQGGGDGVNADVFIATQHDASHVVLLDHDNLQFSGVTATWHLTAEQEAILSQISAGEKINIVIAGFDVAPDFGAEDIEEQIFIVDEEIEVLQLPEATGGNGALTYSISPAIGNGLSFDPTTRQITGTPLGGSDESYTYTVTDADGDTDTIQFNLAVLEGMDAPPLTPGMFRDFSATVGTAFSHTITRASGGTPLYTYDIPIAPSWLRISGRTLSGTPTAVGRFRFLLITTDSAGVQRGVSYWITVSAAAVDTSPDFGSATIADQNLTAGTAMTTIRLPRATGGESPLAYSVSALPAGLTFAVNTRILRGTPSAPGTTAMTYTVTDADGDTDTITFDIVVASADTTPVLPAIADQSAVVGTAFSLTFDAATGGNAPLVYRVSGNPSWLSLSGRTLSGNPNATGSHTVTVTVTDSDSDTDSEIFTLTVSAAPVVDTSPDFGTESVANQAYTQNTPITALQLPIATGGDGTLAYMISGQPTGLSLNAARQLVGTPTQTGTFTTTYTVTDADSDTDTIQFDITVEVSINSVPPQVGERVRILLTTSGLYQNANGKMWYDRRNGANVGALSNDSDIEIAGDIDIHRFYLITHADVSPKELRVVSDDSGYGDLFGSGGVAENSDVYIATPHDTEHVILLDHDDLQYSGYTATWHISDSQFAILNQIAVDEKINIVIAGFDVGEMDTPPVLPAIADQSAVVGTAFSLTFDAATGGNAPLVYRVSGNPSWLSLSGRTLSGNPNATGSHTVTVTVTDSDSDTDSEIFTLTVSAAPVVDTSPDFGTATVANQAYTQNTPITALQLPIATGGDGTLVYSTSALPAGLSFNPNNRQITGTPTAPGTTAMTYTVTDADSDTDTIQFNIVVAVVTTVTPASGAGNLLMEIEIDETTTLRGGISPMRLADGTEYFDFEVREISSLKQSVGNLENPRIVPESASIVIDKKSLSGYDLTNRAIKIINQKSSIVTNRDILFNGFIQFPDGIQETQDTIKIDVENRFAGLSKKLVLKKYRASAGAEYEGKYIPAYFGHFTNAVARLHDATNHQYIVSSLALIDSNDCPIVVRNNGAVVNASNYQINYADAIVDFSSSQGTGAITVDGCGVHRGHTDVIKWILKNITGLTDAEINDTSFNAITSITIGRKIEQNNFDGLNLLAELLFETLCELTFQNNQAVLHSRYSDSVGEIPVSAIIQQPRSNNRWDEKKNSARLYANRVGLDDGSYFYDDLIEQSRVGKIVEKILALKWYQENLAGRNKRLQATAQTFGGQESALISSSFDDRALGVNVGDVRTIEGQDYYVTEKNTESKEQISVGLSLWKRPNRAFAPFITSIKPKSGEPDDFEVEWDSIVGLESVWTLGITALSDNTALAISGAVGTKKGTVDISEQLSLSGTEFEARISNANAISDPVKFYNYPAEILTAQTSSEVVTLTWNVGGNGAGTRTWYGDGKKYRVERKLSSETWAQAVVQDFEGQTTKAWSVQISGLVAGQTHNLRMYRVQGVVSGAISNVANATPVAGTLTAPVVTVRQDGTKVVATWTQRPNATTYEARWRKGTSGNWTTLRDNVSPVTITENGTSGVYQVEVQAKAYGWTASSWGRGQITFVQTLRDPQFSVSQQSAGSSRFTVRITSAPDSPDQYAIAYRDLSAGSFGWTGGVVVSTITHTFTITAASVPNSNANSNTNPRMGFRVRSRRSGWNPSNYVIVDLGYVTIPAS